MARIFVVEDDASLREELMRLLELQGHTALTGTAFDRIVDDVLAAAPDCVILDLKLPGTGGHTVCRDLRRSSQVPVIMLTSSDSEFDEVLSMNLGADDYVTKPYNPAVLLARIQSVLRRTQRTEPPTRIEHRGVVLDVARGRVEHGGRSVDLTRNELKILHMLMANHDTINLAPGADGGAVAVRCVHRRQHADRQHQPFAQEPGEYRRARRLPRHAPRAGIRGVMRAPRRLRGCRAR